MDEGLAPESNPTETKPRRRRWPLGALTGIAVAFVVGGVLIINAFGGDTAGSGTTSTISGLPELGSLPQITGNIAPVFTIDLLDGTTFSLEDHLADDGRPVLLNLWASWCTPCREEMPALDAAAASHPGVYFIGVAVEDDPVAAQQFADEIGVSYPLAIDESERVGRLYPSPGLPTTILISGDGVIVRTVFGGLDEAEIDELLSAAFGL